MRGRCLSKRRRQADGWTPRNPVSQGTESKPYKNEIFGHFFFHPLFFLMQDLHCFSDLKYTLMGSLNRLLSCPAKDNNRAARKSSSDFCKTVDIYYTLGFKWERDVGVTKTCKRPRSNRIVHYSQGNLLLPVSHQRLCIHTLVSVFLKNYRPTYPVFIYLFIYLLNNTGYFFLKNYISLEWCKYIYLWLVTQG